MTSCARNGCTGEIENDYCNVCGHAAAPAPSTQSDVYPVAEPSIPFPTNPTGPGTGGRPAGGVLGTGLVEVPPVPYRDPTEVVLRDPEVPEERRFCGNSGCGRPVGRSRAGRAGRPEGFCPHDGTPFSFTPKLVKGDLVAGQYEVQGCLAHGGLGWIYLAADRNLDGRWVVLKGLLNTTDADALSAAEAERRFLTTVDHPNIVKIFNFVRHPDPGTGTLSGYLVMEYVGGSALHDLLRQRLRETGGRQALPLRVSIPYALEILRAFGYLHDHGMLYCDLKPANVIQIGQDLKLVDLGAVRLIDDLESDIYGTIGYQAPEIGNLPPSISSDLYTVGRTLAVLSFPFSPVRVGADGPEQVPIPAAESGECETLRRFLQRATHHDPAARFTSAAEMAEQLTGVLREIRAGEDGVPFPAQSGIFGPERNAAGAAVAEDGERVLGQLAAGAAAAALPVPLIDPADPSAAALTGLFARTPGELVTLVESLPTTPETLLTRARILAEQGSPKAVDAITKADRELPGDWRVTWHRGVYELTSGFPDRAVALFDECFSMLPGECAPKLAMAFADECAGRHEEAAYLYETVWRTDHNYVSAAFGLARTRRTDPAIVSSALEAVPRSSSHYVAAQLALVAATVRERAADEIDGAELAAAGERLLDLEHVDPVRRGLLAAEVLEAALTWLGRRQSRRMTTGATILGVPFTPTGVRQELERVYRTLARTATSRSERNARIDRANAVRPRTWV
jgi:serine/threonine-protein kinase PknG